MRPYSGTRSITTHFSSSHQGTDWSMPIGTSLIAVKDGVITDLPNVSTRKLMGNLTNTQHWSSVKTDGQNSGNVITVKHSDGTYACYLHVSPYSVSTLRGKTVKQGDVVGKSGHNGWSTGPHLHYEIWKNGVRVDPGAYLTSILKEEEMVTKTGVIVLFRWYLGKEPTQAYYDKYVGKVTFDDLNAKIRGGLTYADRIEKAKAGTLNAVNHLPSTLRSAYVAPPAPGVTVLPPGNYVVK